MFNRNLDYKNRFMLTGKFAKKGYDWWWHSFTGYNSETKEEQAFFIEFFIINPKVSPSKVILGQSKEAKNNNLKPSYLMVKCGTWGKGKKQLHAFYPLNDVTINKCPISIKTSNTYLDSFKTYGKVEVNDVLDGMMCDKGCMEWDLSMDKQISFDVGYGTSKFFQFTKAFEMYWNASGMKTYYEGTITLDGVKYDIIPDKSYGYADKNWGNNFTSPWVWLSSNHIMKKGTNEVLPNTVFDIGGGNPKAFGIVFHDTLLGAYMLEGKEYEMNFSKFFHPCTTKYEFTEKDETVSWHIEHENKKYLIMTDVKCKKEDMLFINYEDPNGMKNHNKLWNGGNGTGTLKLYEKKKDTKTLLAEYDCLNVGCEYGKFDD